MRSIAATGSQSRSTKSGFHCKRPHDESDVGFGSERHGINDRRLLNQRIKRSNHAVGSRSERLRPIVGTWQLTRGVVNGEPVPLSVARNTILITDHNTFRFPKASGVGTHPAGTFTVNPDTKPKQVDSIAEGGLHAGHLTRGIYEILDTTHKRACWGPPGGPRPTEFKSAPGSGWILQYWKKIGPVPSS